MGELMNKYEYMIMRCAVKQAQEFSIMEMREFLRAAGEKKLGLEGIRIYLERLVKKKMVKKRRVRTAFLKFEPRYQACYSEESFLSRTKELDINNEEEKAAWDKEWRRKRNAHKRMLTRGFMISEEGYYTQEEKEKIKKAIDEME